jgi:hypothetical protein
MTMTAKMSRCADGVPGRIRFTFPLGKNPSEDVVFEPRTIQTADPSLFGESLIAADWEAYDIATNDPNCSAQGLWQPSQRTLVVKINAAAPKKYCGNSLDDCVEQAYNHGTFR